MPNKYKDFEIELWDKSFSPDANLVRVSVYIVKSADIYCLFVFGDGLLARMSHPDVSEEDIEKVQFEMIKEKIDNGTLENYGEYVFQYHGHNYLEEDNVHWWKRSLKQQAEESGLLQKS